MGSTDQLDETSSNERTDFNLRESTPDKDVSTNLIVGFVCLFLLFTAIAYISQCIIFQALDSFSRDIRNMEDICDRYGNSFNDEKCECIFNYLQGLDHPQFQYYFHKLQLPTDQQSKKPEFDPERPLMDPTAYVVGCGNNYLRWRIANEDICEELEKLMTTDLYTKWWYDSSASCFNSLFNTIRRVHPGMVIAFIVVLTGIFLTPIRLLRVYEII